MSVVFVHFSGLYPFQTDTPGFHKDYKEVALRFYSTFVKKINTEDFYFFILTNEQIPSFKRACKLHGIDVDASTVAKSESPIQNARYPEDKPVLNWFVLKFKELPSQFSPHLTRWFEV